MIETEATEVRDLLQEVLSNDTPPNGAMRVHQLKRRVFRVEIVGPAPRRSVILKELEPLMAQRCQLVAQRWLPALGLADRCACLLGSAADRSGARVWHAYEDLGDATLKSQPAPERVDATVDLIAELHTRAARHAVLPDARRYGCAFGIEYFTTNVRDALASLDALAAAGIRPPSEHAGLPERLHERLATMLAGAGARARAFHESAGPDTLLHGDVWTINAFVSNGGDGPRARLVDWDRMGVGPWTYDVSAFLMQFPRPERPRILARYCRAVTHKGWRLAPPSELEILFDTAERARYANRVIWAALALVHERAAWGFPELAEVERWFLALDAASPMVPR